VWRTFRSGGGRRTRRTRRPPRPGRWDDGRRGCQREKSIIAESSRVRRKGYHERRVASHGRPAPMRSSGSAPRNGRCGTSRGGRGRSRRGSDRGLEAGVADRQVRQPPDTPVEQRADGKTGRFARLEIAHEIAEGQAGVDDVLDEQDLAPGDSQVEVLFDAHDPPACRRRSA